MTRFLCCLLCAFVFTGCISASVSPTPRFYMLHSVDKDAVGEKFNMPADIIIGVGPVKIPQYLNRPQIVTQDKNKMLTFAQLDRWGEPLDSGLERLIAENLTLMLPGASLQLFPCNFAIPLKYQLILDVVQLDCDLEANLFLVVQWSIIDAQKKEMLVTQRAEFVQPINPHNYTGLVRALETACISLSRQIAQACSGLAQQEKIK